MVYALVFAVTLALSSVSNAATYYVATTGNDSNNGSSGSPYRTMLRCTQSPTAPGDTCIVRNGTYVAADIGRTDYALWLASSQGSVAGSAGNPITLKSENYLGAVVKVPSVNAGSSAMRISQPYWIVEGFDINGTGTVWNTGSSAAAAGITVVANNVTIRRNHIWDIARTMCSDSAFGQSGILISNNVQNTLIEYNQFNKIGRLRNGESGCSTSAFQHDHGIYSSGDDFTTIRYNVIYDTNRGYPIHIFASGSTHADINIYNNTISGGSPTTLPAGQIILCNINTRVNIRNNIFHAAPLGYPVTYCPSTTATSVVISNNIQDSNDNDATDDMQNPSSKPASGVTASGNIFNATLGLTSTTSGSENYTLLSTSAALNAGVDVGLAYNGAAPEMGAFEAPAFASCEITGATNIRVTFVNNANPPLLPASSATTFTARRNTVSNTVTGVARNGDNLYDITVTTSYGGGDSGDISWASGNITDSALLGGVWNQKYIAVLTNQTCTNSVGGASYTLAQAAFEFRAAEGQEASPLVLPHGFASTGAAENFVNYPVMKGGKHRLRFALTCAVAACPDAGYYLRYSLNGGAYTVVPDAFTADNIAFCGVIPHTPANGSTTTEQLSTSGTFTPGGIVFTSNAIPTISGFASGNKTEVEYCLKYDQDASTHYDFRVYTQSGAALNTYTVTPRVVIQDTASGGVGQ